MQLLESESAVQSGMESDPKSGVTPSPCPAAQEAGREALLGLVRGAGAVLSGQSKVDQTSLGHGARAEPADCGMAAGSTHARSANGATYGRTRGSVYVGEVAVDDLDVLLCAVKARLRRTVGDGPAIVDGGARAETAQRSADLVKSGVLDCVRALDQIQVTLARELAQRSELERELADTQMALAEALADLSGTEAGERHARHVAQHDSLTSLPNRGFFLERLDAEVASLKDRRQDLAVLYLDLGEVKPIGDRYGHDMGDELLRIVGMRLARSVRSDDIVCRLGGDKFGCLLTEVHGRAQLGVLALKLIDAVSAPLQIGKCKLVVRPSIGIAVSPVHGTSSEDLLRNADSAMNRAKRHQTGYAFFD
jgi:diguanylate cyclase (GGDEF)-like protein